VRRVLALVAAAVVAAGATVVTVPAHAETGSTTSYESIPGDGGTVLKAFVVRPTGRGDGPFPLLVMPSSWSLLDVEYVGAAVKLARDSGYVVVSYTSRGFWDSGGEIDVAGDKDTADASRVIDWAVQNADADEHRVGMAGISYGAGIGLLAAANDPRVRAVAALSGWADLIASLYPNQTVSEQAAGGLLLLGNVTGRPGADLLKVQNAYLTDDIAAAIPLAASRGVGSHLGQINANRPAVLLGNAWEDGIFPPSQLTDFYDRFTGPKHLMLQPGDHGSADLLGAVGLPNDEWAAATRWFDHYLKGTANGIDRERPVVLKAANGGGWQSFPSWAAISSRTGTFYLGGGTLDGRAVTGWSDRIDAGWPTVADSGVLEVTGVAQQAGIPWKIKIADVNRAFGGVWSARPYTRATVVSGAPRLHATITPSAADTSLFAYLYDVAPGGEGSLITHEPFTLRGAAPGRAHAVDFRLEPIRWTVPAGHHLALVIDTTDIRYRSTSKPGATVTFGSPPSDPSWLTVPTG
jgi:putative CocE/NonD family hydrolase